MAAFYNDETKIKTPLFFNKMKKKNKYILGISAFSDDSAAALLKDDYIVAAAAEERFTRKKHDSAFPVNAIKYCLHSSGISLSDLDAVIFYELPFFKFNRFLKTQFLLSPFRILSFFPSALSLLKESLALKKIIAKKLLQIEPHCLKNKKIIFCQHQLSYAGSAFYPSPFKEAAVLTVNGFAEFTAASIGYAKEEKISILRELRFPDSLGLLYSAFTYYLGFAINSGESKLMGLASYGDSKSSQFKEYSSIIKTKLVSINEDGSIFLNRKLFDFASGSEIINKKKWQSLFGMPLRKADDELTSSHCNLALAIQRVTEEVVFNLAKEAKRLTNAKYLCLSGGVALNCVSNGKLFKSSLFEDIWIQPASSDAGGAIGAVYSAYHMYFNAPRFADNQLDKMQYAYLGPEFSDSDIRLVIDKYNLQHKYYDDFSLLCKDAAELMADGNIIAWFQGRMEWGPRALGNRSILADARDPQMQQKLNLMVKFREDFRPFAPSVLLEDANIYFELSKHSPYMLLVTDIAKDKRKPLPQEYQSLTWREKLICLRSEIPAVTHVDFSARVQTVEKDANPKFYELLKHFKEKTGCSLIINTSFNVKEEPIVCTPEDAYMCFSGTNIDYLVMGNYLIDKKLLLDKNHEIRSNR